MNKNLTIGLAIIICAAVYGLYLLIPAITGTYNSYKDLNSSKEQIAQIKQQIADLESAKAAHVQKESAITKPIYKNDTPTSDSMSSFGVMFEDVIQAAKYNKLKLYSIAYNMAPADDLVYQNVQSEYNVCEISMQLYGTYPQFKSYFQDIYNYPYLINISKLEIIPYERDRNILGGNIKIVLYSKKVS